MSDMQEWARLKCSDHPEIVRYMRNSFDPLERAIAIRILKNADQDPDDPKWFNR